MADPNPGSSPKGSHHCPGNGQAYSISHQATIQASTAKKRPAAQLILPPPPPVEDLDDLLLVSDNTANGLISFMPNDEAKRNDAQSKAQSSSKSKAGKRKSTKNAKKRSSNSDNGNQRLEIPSTSLECNGSPGMPISSPSSISASKPPRTSPKPNRLVPNRPSSIQQIIHRRPPNPLLNADMIVYNNGNGRCNVCLVQYCTSHFPVPPTPLLQCCGCRLVFYCTPVHQRADWSAHKQMCRVIRDLLQKHEIDHIYAIRGPFRFSSQRNFLITKAEVLRQVQLELKRPLKAVEKNQLAWPKMCAVCFVYDPAKLDNCKFCNAAWFCHNEHRENQIIAVHPPGLCIQLRLYYSMVVVGEQRTIDHPEPLQRLDPREPFPTNLFNLVNLSAGTRFSSNPLTDAQNLDFSAVCNFSNVATLLTAIRQAELLDENQECLNVHIVGASSEITLFTRHECWLLFRWLPATIRQIELVFVGPELPEGLADYRDLLFGDNLQCRLRFARMCYEDYPQTDKSPHLCICYNSGFLEQSKQTTADDNPWTAGMKRIMDVCTNIAFTSYVRVEAEADLNWVISIAAARQALPFVWQRWNVQNEYRDLRPHRNAHMEANDKEEIYFCNGYLSVMTLNRQP